jgi:8-hydroxy-5-deazaflavin:NADPH oxidoreductase
MRIGIIGAGNIGGNLARLLAGAGHRVTVSFSRDPAALARLAEQLGATATTPAEAARDAEVIVLAVPWGVVDEALAAAGGAAGLAGRLVLDTTNQFERRDGALAVLDLGGESASAYNARKAPGARWVKVFNTLTAGFQASSAGRTGPDRVVMFYATDEATDATTDDATTDDIAVATVERLVNDAGFDPVRTGTFARDEVGHQEPKGDLYGEEFHHDGALELVAKLRGTPPSGRGRP